MRALESGVKVLGAERISDYWAYQAIYKVRSSTKPFV